jgi:hypothetical protein
MDINDIQDDSLRKALQAIDRYTDYVEGCCDCELQPLCELFIDGENFCNSLKWRAENSDR